MDSFSVKPNVLEGSASSLSNIANRLNRIAGSVESVRYGLSWEIKAKHQINTNLKQINTSLENLSSKTNKYGKTLGNCAQWYVNSENRILSNAGGKTPETVGSRKVGDSSASVNETVDWFKYTFGKVVKSTADCVSAVKDFYQNNKQTIKQYGKAAIKIVGGIAAVSVSIGAIVGTAGGATPVTGISLMYGINDIVSGIGDVVKITNNLQAGETSEIEETDYLREAIVSASQSVGKELGYEKAGAIIGECLYGSGKIITSIYTIETSVSKVTQASDFNLAGMAQEIKQVPRGMWDLAAHTDIGQLSYQTKLFSYTIPNTVNAVKNISIIGGLSESLIGSPGKWIKNSMTGKNNIFGGFYGTIQGVSEKAMSHI